MPSRPTGDKLSVFLLIIFLRRLMAIVRNNERLK